MNHPPHIDLKELFLTLPVICSCGAYPGMDPEEERHFFDTGKDIVCGPCLLEKGSEQVKALVKDFSRHPPCQHVHEIPDLN